MKLTLARAAKLLENVMDTAGCGCCADYDERKKALEAAREFIEAVRKDARK